MEEKRYMQAAQDLNLLCIGKSAGVVYWKPSGLKLYENLKNFIRLHHEKRGYQEVRSPSLVASEVFEQSGHSDKYKENMFFIAGEDNYALRPMSCPNHILIYQSERRSYKELALPFFEFGEVYRNEPSGSLQLLFRQRQFCQDDSHVFVSAQGLVQAISNYLEMAQEVYSQLGFEKIHYAISLRPQKRFGSEQNWDKAENALRLACFEHQIEFEELLGEGAFYGPKIELKVQDKIGRFWQLGTLQLDYVLPERFNLEFINAENQSEVPILLHHAVLGSLERMIGILLESFGEHLPDFLHPYPKVVVAVSEKSNAYASQLAKYLVAKVDDSNEPLGKKLAFWRAKGVPAIYVVGEKEAKHFEQSGQYQAMLNQGEKKEIVNC